MHRCPVGAMESNKPDGQFVGDIYIMGGPLKIWLKRDIIKFDQFKNLD